MAEFTHREVPVTALSPQQREKWLKFGSKNYRHCAYSLHVLHDFDKAVYDEELDLMFEDHKARITYIKELKTGVAIIPDEDTKEQKSNKKPYKKFAKSK